MRAAVYGPDGDLRRELPLERVSPSKWTLPEPLELEKGETLWTLIERDDGPLPQPVIYRLPTPS